MVYELHSKDVKEVLKGRYEHDDYKRDSGFYKNTLRLIEQLENKNKECKVTLLEIQRILEVDCGEINIQNFSNDEVIALNDAANNIYRIVRKMLDKLEKGK